MDGGAVGHLLREADGWVINLGHFEWPSRNLDALYHPQTCLPRLLG